MKTFVRALLRRAWPLAIVALTATAAGADVITTTLDATPPVQGVSYFNQVTGHIVGPRLFRDGMASSCSVGKAAPGGFGSGSFRYDAYTFTATETACMVVRVRLVGTNAGPVHAQVHSTFDPEASSEGWLADMGTSVITENETRAFSVMVEEGQSYTLVVYHTVTAAEGTQYEVSFEEPFTGTTVSAVDGIAPEPDVRYSLQRTGALTGVAPVRDGQMSTCGGTRTSPGTTGTMGTFSYDSYQFIASTSGCLTVTLRQATGAGDLQAVAYTGADSDEPFTGWLGDAGVSAASPGPVSQLVSFSVPVTMGQVFRIIVFNHNAEPQPPAAYELSLSLPVQPPRTFRVAAVSGNTVTFRWRPSLDGPVPDGYVVEGGVQSGEVLATIPAGAAPVLTASVPTGAFHVRVRAVRSGQTSAASNEVRVFVNVPVLPSAPANLLVVVNGTTLGLSWRNTFQGGAPAVTMLDVAGAATTSINLGTGDRGSFAGVPGGTYTVRLRSVNAAGSSAQADPVTFTIPGGCSGLPQPPPGFQVFRVGNRVTALWDAPTTGPAPVGYTLQVTGSGTASYATTARSLSGTVSPGTYNLAVLSNNGCGVSVATPVQTITIP